MGCWSRDSRTTITTKDIDHFFVIKESNSIDMEAVIIKLYDWQPQAMVSFFIGSSFAFVPLEVR